MAPEQEVELPKPELRQQEIPTVAAAAPEKVASRQDLLYEARKLRTKAQMLAEGTRMFGDKPVTEYTGEERIMMAGQRRRAKAGSAIIDWSIGLSKRKPASPDRKYISVDELAFNTAKPEIAYFPITVADTLVPERLAEKLAEGSRVSKVPRNITRRVVALLDKKDESIHLVSAYDHPNQGMRVWDMTLKELMAKKHLRPFAGILVIDPVNQSFHQRYASEKEFNEKWGTAADQAKLRAQEFANWTELRFEPVESPETDEGFSRGFEQIESSDEGLDLVTLGRWSRARNLDIEDRYELRKHLSQLAPYELTAIPGTEGIRGEGGMVVGKNKTLFGMEQGWVRGELRRALDGVPLMPEEAQAMRYHLDDYLSKYAPEEGLPVGVVESGADAVRLAMTDLRKEGWHGALTKPGDLGDWKIKSAYAKLFRELIRRRPELKPKYEDDPRALDALAKELYEDHQNSPSLKDFVEKQLAKAGPEVEQAIVGLASPRGAAATAITKELTLPYSATGHIRPTHFPQAGMKAQPVLPGPEALPEDVRTVREVSAAARAAEKSYRPRKFEKILGTEVPATTEGERFRINRDIIRKSYEKRRMEMEHGNVFGGSFQELKPQARPPVLPDYAERAWDLRQPEEQYPEPVPQMWEKGKPVPPSESVDIRRQSPASLFRAIQHRKDRVRFSIERMGNQLAVIGNRRETKRNIFAIRDGLEGAGNTYAKYAANSIRISAMDDMPAHLRGLGYTWARRNFRKAQRAEMDKVLSGVVVVKATMEKMNKGDMLDTRQLALVNSILGLQAPVQQVAAGQYRLMNDLPAIVPNRNKLAVLRAYADRGVANAENLIRTKIWRGQRVPEGVAVGIGEKWKAAALKWKEAIDYSDRNWTDFKPGVWGTTKLSRATQVFTRELKDQFDMENAAGITKNEVESYVPSMYSGEFFNDGAIMWGAHQIIGQQFTKPKSFKNYFEAIADADGPYVPASFNAADLAQSRIARGQFRMNHEQWRDYAKGVIDPESGEPLAINAEPIIGPIEYIDPVTGAVSTRLGPTGRWKSPNPSYDLIENSRLAVRKGYKRVFDLAEMRSNIDAWPGGRPALFYSSAMKHGLILIADTFHPGRLFQVLTGPGRDGQRQGDRFPRRVRRTQFPRARHAGGRRPRPDCARIA